MRNTAVHIAAVPQLRNEVAGEAKRPKHAHPLYLVLTSMPGVGVRTAIRLLIEVTHKALASAAHLVACGGLAPVTRARIRRSAANTPKRDNKVPKRTLLLSICCLQTTLSRACHARKIQLQPSSSRWLGAAVVSRSPNSQLVCRRLDSCRTQSCRYLSEHVRINKIHIRQTMNLE